jgi:SpoVK/Ycf46/Vps4 family AAA+-type ATPase
MVRSYFLNAVDGLESNHGILMIGSTNHLERLDPGIAKRPSRFDRKYLFDMPNRAERIQYSQYWRKKLSGNKKIEFPEVLCEMIADITDGFSFAYMKEAFVASLLVIVANKREYEAAETTAVVAADAITAREANALRLRLHRPSWEQQPLIVLGNCMIVGGGGGDGGDEDPDGRKQAEKTLLWKEIQKQVKILRDEMESENATVGSA